MKKVLLALVTLLIVIVAAVQFYTWGKLPSREGNFTLNGLSKPVTVVYDEWAIPHIQAKTEKDMFRALGFVHAQDRLFQMDMLRRVGKGELAALIGEPGIKVDKLFRTLGTREFSFEQADYIKQHTPQLAELLEAYYDGINQAIATLPTPVEYDILQAEPETFSIVDGMGIFAYVAHSFTGGLSTDPLITALSQTVSPEHFAELVLSWPVDVKHNNQPSPLSTEELISFADQSDALIDALPFGLVHGSNAWAISPDRSQSGKALLANDPHIAFASPSVWYETQVTAPGVDIYGHYLAGVPFPLLMRKENLAQGLTMLTADDADLIALEYSQDKSQILLGGQWQKIQRRTENIKVKGADSVNFEIEQTSLGPIINHVLNIENTAPVALYWVYTNPDNHLFSTIFDMYRAEDMQQLEDAMSQLLAPGLNMLYADAKGNIAQWAFGRYTKRPQGNNGKVIVDGTQAKNLPQGQYPFEHNPKIINPDSGYLFSTNHAFPNSQPETEHLGYYSPVHRAMWADEKLAEGDDWNIAKMQQLQIESANKRWELAQPILKNVLTVDNLSAIEMQAWNNLQNWQGQYLPDSTEPVIFERFHYHLLHGVFADEMGNDLFNRVASKSFMDNSLYRLLESPDGIWWDNQTTDVTEQLTTIFQQAFSNAIASLEGQLGSNVEDWQWQNVASLTHNHPLGKVKPLDMLFNVGPFAIDGSRRSLNNMQFKYSDGDLIVTNGPSTRRVIDFADPKHAFTVLPTGQSGNVFDPHYDDQAALYHANGYRQATMLERGEIPDKAKVLNLLP